ncbi:IS481 family transposase, partial [Mycolicibacter sinensis]
DWLHHCNHRPHTGIGGKSPTERLRVHNLPVKNT